MKKKWKDLLFTAICANGAFLPPVIVTSDKRLKNLPFSGGRVILLPGTKGQSNRATECWLEAIEEYLEDKPLVLFDNHKSHYSTTLTEDLKLREITTMHKRK